MHSAQMVLSASIRRGVLRFETVKPAWQGIQTIAPDGSKLLLIIPIGARQAVKRCQIAPVTTDGRAQYIPPSDLLIPVYSHTGAWQGIQTIAPAGSKLLRGSLKHGLLWIASKSEPLQVIIQHFTDGEHG